MTVRTTQTKNRTNVLAGILIEPPNRCGFHNQKKTDGTRIASQYGPVLERRKAGNTAKAGNGLMSVGAPDVRRPTEAGNINNAPAVNVRIENPGIGTCLLEER
jgi:hypothetical protein